MTTVHGDKRSQGDLKSYTLMDSVLDEMGRDSVTACTNWISLGILVICSSLGQNFRKEGGITFSTVEYLPRGTKVMSSTLGQQGQKEK